MRVPLRSRPKGPVSMASEDIRQKYRDEITRAKAFEACQVRATCTPPPSPSLHPICAG
jgi:hypothetical protein